MRDSRPKHTSAYVKHTSAYIRVCETAGPPLLERAKQRVPELERDGRERERERQNSRVRQQVQLY